MNPIQRLWSRTHGIKAIETLASPLHSHSDPLLAASLSSLVLLPRPVVHIATPPSLASSQGSGALASAPRRDRATRWSLAQRGTCLRRPLPRRPRPPHVPRRGCARLLPRCRLHLQVMSAPASQHGSTCHLWLPDPCVSVLLLFLVCWIYWFGGIWLRLIWDCWFLFILNSFWDGWWGITWCFSVVYPEPDMPSYAGTCGIIHCFLDPFFYPG